LSGSSSSLKGCRDIIRWLGRAIRLLSHQTIQTDD